MLKVTFLPAQSRHKGRSVMATTGLAQKSRLILLSPCVSAFAPLDDGANGAPAWGAPGCPLRARARQPALLTSRFSHTRASGSPPGPPAPALCH